jgi:hypothetical protein
MNQTDRETVRYRHLRNQHPLQHQSTRWPSEHPRQLHPNYNLHTPKSRRRFLATDDQFPGRESPLPGKVSDASTVAADYTTQAGMAAMKMAV